MICKKCKHEIIIYESIVPGRVAPFRRYKCACQDIFNYTTITITSDKSDPIFIEYKDLDKPQESI